MIEHSRTRHQLPVDEINQVISLFLNLPLRIVYACLAFLRGTDFLSRTSVNMNISDAYLFEKKIHVGVCYILSPCEPLAFLLDRASTRLAGAFRGGLVAFLGAKLSVPLLSACGLDGCLRR